MLSQERVDEVRRLLADPERPSQRRIAIITGVSRASVGAIASGRRPDYAPRTELRDDEPLSFGRLVWCTGCGHNVYLLAGECKLCADSGRTRSYLEPRRQVTDLRSGPHRRPGTDRFRGEPPSGADGLADGDETIAPPIDGLASPVDLDRRGTNHF
ncbi:MAG TPA: hypothetical protein VGG64_08900 [Pirellulales bacterium]|jgi:hypothetical protein